MEELEEPRWSIGELSAATGVTVRALHHYDSIGLLQASTRTGAGHRRYTERDLRRLYSIRTLRSLGVPLGDIATLLDRAGTGPDALQRLLRRQLDALAGQALQLEELQRMWNDNNVQLSQALPWTADQLQALMAHLQAARDAG